MFPMFRLRARDHIVDFPRRPLVMGIVNINDDSFSGDGTLDGAVALARAREMVRQGADIIDAGAESARTNRGPISVGEELDRLGPFVAAFASVIAGAGSSSGSGGSGGSGEAPPGEGQIWPPLLSINTWRPEVARAILAVGGDILNDIGGLPDGANAAACARSGAALVVMHTAGAPKEPRLDARYHDVMATLEAFFEEKSALAASAGLPEDHLILDPGIDFAKQREDNLTIYRDLKRLERFHRPILLPVSRKTVIGEVLGLENPVDRDAGTVACSVAGLLRGASILRVHNVPAAAAAAKVLDALSGASRQ